MWTVPAEAKVFAAQCNGINMYTRFTCITNMLTILKLGLVSLVGSLPRREARRNYLDIYFVRIFQALYAFDTCTTHGC